MNITDAIYKLYPNVVRTVGDIAYDADGNEVAYNMEDAQAKLVELEANEIAKQEAAQAAKESALSKLAKLGLSQDEIKALVG